AVLDGLRRDWLPGAGMDLSEPVVLKCDNIVGGDAGWIIVPEESHELAHRAPVALIGGQLRTFRFGLRPPAFDELHQPAMGLSAGVRVFPRGEPRGLRVGPIVAFGVALELLRRIRHANAYLAQQNGAAGLVDDQPLPLEGDI